MDLTPALEKLSMKFPLMRSKKWGNLGIVEFSFGQTIASLFFLTDTQCRSAWCEPLAVLMTHRDSHLLIWPLALTIGGLSCDASLAIKASKPRAMVVGL